MKVKHRVVKSRYIDATGDDIRRALAQSVLSDPVFDETCERLHLLMLNFDERELRLDIV